MRGKLRHSKSRQRFARHPASHAARQNQLTGSVAAELPVSHRGKRFKRTCTISLRADVDPTAGRHLAVHHQTLAFEFVEVFPVGPVADQIRVRKSKLAARFVCAKDADGLPDGTNKVRRFSAPEVNVRSRRTLPLRAAFDATIDDEIIGRSATSG